MQVQYDPPFGVSIHLMKLFFALAVLAITLAGCAMYKLGVTQDQADHDAYECRREARTITRGAVFDAYRDCMHDRGYQ